MIQWVIAQQSSSNDPFASLESKNEEENKGLVLCQEPAKHLESSVALRASFVSALADEEADWSLQRAQARFSGLKKLCPPTDLKVESGPEKKKNQETSALKRRLFQLAISSLEKR